MMLDTHCKKKCDGNKKRVQCALKAIAVSIHDTDPMSFTLIVHQHLFFCPRVAQTFKLQEATTRFQLQVLRFLHESRPGLADLVGSRPSKSCSTVCSSGIRQRLRALALN